MIASYGFQPDIAASSKALDIEAARQPCGRSSSCGRFSTAAMRETGYGIRTSRLPNMQLQATKANTREVATRLTSR
jgi:hypothetical protein